MSVFTKGQKSREPRCDALTQTGARCQLHGTYNDGGRTFCVHHRAGGVRLRSMKSQTPPKEVEFVASYSDGRDITRKVVSATDRDSAQKLAIQRAPSNHTLFNLRRK